MVRRTLRIAVACLVGYALAVSPAFGRTVQFAGYTWSDSPEYEHRELDVEFSRWGDAANQNAQYVVQPYTIPENIVRFDLPAGITRSTHGFDWRAGSVVFESTDDTASTQIRRWTFTNAIPVPGDEAPRINLWLFGGNRPMNRSAVEVVVRSFAFVPAA